MVKHEIVLHPPYSKARWRGSSRLGQIPNFYRKFVLQASLIIRTGSGMVEFETTEEAVEALVLVNNLRVEGVQGEAEGMEFDIKLCFSRTFV